MSKEQPSTFYDEVYRTGGSGKEYFKAPEECVYYPAWQRVMSFLDKKKDTILELGCGPGQLAQLLIKDGYGYNGGIDFSKQAISMAIQRNLPYGQMFICEDISDPELYEYPDYNTIIICEVLEHIEKDIQLIKLWPKGTKVVFSVPNYNSKSHVRYFPTDDSIGARYFDVLDIETIVRIDLPHHSNKLFVIKATVK